MQDHKVTLSNGQVLEIQELDGLLINVIKRRHRSA